ncbi:hypothetical protein GOODEAATRI_022555, partial [Goodea atripinnis]
SFLGVMCSRVLLNKNQGEEIMGECPLPAIKLSLDWLKLRASIFQEAARLVESEGAFVSSAVMPLPEEFELQGFLALRPALRCLDFTKGHQGILVDRDGLPVHARHQRLTALGKWVADNQPGLIQCQVNEDGLLLFLTDIPEEAIEEPQERDAPVLQESSNGEQTQNDGGNSGLKSVLSAGKTQSSWSDSSERPVVTFKENIKPREQSQEPARNHPQKEFSKERREFPKGNGTAAGKAEMKRDGKRKSEMKKAGHEKTADVGKQVGIINVTWFKYSTQVLIQSVMIVLHQVKAQTELRKTPVSEVKKTPVTQTQTTCSSQFIPIHHPGAFPPLPSRPGTFIPVEKVGFPPSAYVIPPPVAFPGLQVNPGFTFSTGVSVPASFLQSAVQDQPAPMWSQSQAALQKMCMKQPQQQQQQAFFMGAQDPLKLYEQQLQQPAQAQISNMDKKMKFPDVKMQDFYWEPSYRMDRMGEGLAMMVERMKRPPPADDFLPLTLSLSFISAAAKPEQDGEQPGGRQPIIFSAAHHRLPHAGHDLHLSVSFQISSEFNHTSIFSRAYGKNLPPSSKPDAPMMQQEPSLYSLFEGNPWSPSLPASSDHSTPASQSPHSSNPSSLPSSPPTHNHGAVSFSNFGPIGTPDSRDRRVLDRWKAEKPGGLQEYSRGPQPFLDVGDLCFQLLMCLCCCVSGTGFGLDYLPAAATSTAPDSSWHQGGSTGSSWTNQESPMEESSSTVLLDSLKVIQLPVRYLFHRSVQGLNIADVSSEWSRAPDLSLNTHSGRASLTPPLCPLQSIWSSSMMQPGPSALEQLLLQQKQKQQRGHGAMNPPH